MAAVIDLYEGILELFTEAQYLGRRRYKVKFERREPMGLRTEHFTRSGVELPLKGLVRISGKGLSSSERRRLRAIGIRPKDITA